MVSFQKGILKKIKEFGTKYPAIVAGIIIYLYYLLTSINFFKTLQEKHTFIDYIIQFDSLLFLWVAAAVIVQIIRIQQNKKQEFERLREIERAVERQKIAEELLNEITLLLQDSVNNPLTVIAVTTQKISRRFENDSEIIGLLRQIDGARQRITDALRDLQLYETQKLSKLAIKSLKKESEG